jgi:phosphatidylinositol alpha-mannosyltransferase
MHRRPLRIGIVVPYDLGVAGGGVKHHALQLAQALRDLGDDVTVLAPTSTPRERAGVVGFSGVLNVSSNGGDNRMALLVSPLRVRSVLAERRFDVLHVHEPLVPALTYWATWCSPGVPKVATFHAYAERPPLQLRAGQRLFGMSMYALFSHAIAVSRAAARYASIAWRRGFTIIGNGVDGDVFSPPEAPAQPAPSARSAMRLLFVGARADPRKGWPHLLEAYRRLRARGVAVTLDVVGDGPPLPRVDGMTVHGATSLGDLVRRYRDADVLVAPSTGQESFGIVLLEAMACARPIVCSDIDGYREVVDAHGARLVPPSDPGALAEALEALVADEAKRAAMGAHNRRRALASHWRAIAPRIREVYVAARAGVRS